MTPRYALESIISLCNDSHGGCYENDYMEDGIDWQSPDDAVVFTATMIRGYAGVGLGEKIKWFDDNVGEE